MQPNNTTTIRTSPQRSLSDPVDRVQTRLSSKVLKAESSPENLRYPGGDVSATTLENNDSIPPPQLDRAFYTFRPEFTSQADLNKSWAALKEYLTSATLQEPDILDVLESGILQTDTGRVVSGLFEDALIRSIRSRANLGEARLKTIIDALCHLPPGQWRAAVGEQARFTSEHRADGVMAFIQSRLDASSEEIRQKIADKQLLSNAQLDVIEELTLDLRQYIRADNEGLFKAWFTLKQDCEMRSSPKEALKHLEALIAELRDPPMDGRKRWNDHVINKVETVRDQLEPDYQGGLARPEKERPVELISLRFFNTPKPVTGQAEFSLLNALQGFERHANFYTNVSTTGPRIPEGFIGKLLYACNALDTFGALRLDSGHISTTGPGPEPSANAWKNGESDFLRSPLTPDPEQPQADALDPMAEVGQFAAHVDELLNRIFRNAVPWDSAHAKEEVELKDLLEPFRDTSYQPATTGLPPDTLTRFSADMEVLKEQLGNWLSRMSASLLGTGVAASSRAVDLIEKNLDKTAAGFVAYWLVSSFFASRFLPELEEAVDPLQGVDIHPEPAPDEEAVAHEYAIEGIEGLFEIFPELEVEVKNLISKTAYEVPADDPELIEKLEELLRQSVPGEPDVTYSDYLDEITVQAKSDAQEEFEPYAASESKVNPVVNTEAQLFVADNPAHVIKTRSVDERSGISSNVKNSESGGVAHLYAQLLIHAGQRSSDADISIGPGEEIAPGVTISQAAETFVDDFVELQTVLDSSLFILSSIEWFVTNSDLPADLKSKVTYSTEFEVEYLTRRPNGKNTGYFQPKIRTTTFTLLDLLTGQHERAKESREELTIKWPSGYTDNFKNAALGAELFENHKWRLDRVISKPHTYTLWKATFDYYLKKQLGDYYKSPTASSLAKEVIEKFSKGEIQIRPIAIKHGESSDKFPVSDAIFLSNRGRSPEGLFVFLGGNGTVIESPAELFREGGKSIEQFPLLSNELSKRIPLNTLLGRNDDDFKYSQGRSFWSHGINYKLSYEPIIIGRKDGPDRYGEDYDVRKLLFYTATVKARADMDSRTSTWDERVVKKLLGILADSLKLYAIILGGPGAPTAGLAFLSGAGASAVKYMQGELDDDPSEGNRLKAEAIKGLVTQIAAPYIGQVFRFRPNGPEEFRIALKTCHLLKLSSALPKEITDFLPAYGHHTTPLELSAKHMGKWIAPDVKLPSAEKLNRRFTSKRIMHLLKSLHSKGPRAAQRLMNLSRVVYFSEENKSYVYRGFTLCGDLRRPEEVFAQGLKSNGPVDNAYDINAMSVSSGIDAGVQASGYYADNRRGAFYDAGKSGGYTYLIDGRGIEGYDVARNKNRKDHPESQAGSNPYRIVYALDIPGSMILGAYDSAGKFTPNQSALNRAIGTSRRAGGVPFPVLPFVQSDNATQRLHELQL